MTVNHPAYGTMCEICFSGLRTEDCATDTDGQKWDVCKGECAKQAGITEASLAEIWSEIPAEALQAVVDKAHDAAITEDREREAAARPSR